jgi:hypothetical protein
MTTELAWTVLKPLVGDLRRRLALVVAETLVPEGKRLGWLQGVLLAAPVPESQAGIATALSQIQAALEDLGHVLERPGDALTAADAARALSAALLGVGRLVDAAAGQGPALALSSNAQRGLNHLAAGVDVPSTGGVIGQLGFADRPVLVFASDRASLRLTSLVERSLLGGLVVGARSLELRLLFSGSLELELSAPGPAVRGLAARLDLPAGSDGLVSAIVPSGASLELELRLVASSSAGLTLGGASRRASLPARTSTPGIQLRGLEVELRESSPPALDIGSILRGELAGFKATLQGFGVTLVLDSTALRVEPKPPTGIGVSIDAGPARGGGFLGRRGTGYGGAFQLSLGFVDVQAFGILDSDVARGGGFSLLVVLGAEFTPAIELGLAFTLNAVGGLIGIQHFADTEAIGAGLRTRALDAVMFPRDVVAEAPRILDTLARLFPARAGAMVAGPMLRLGWGRPISFVTLDVAVVLSLPDPTLLVLGRLRVAVPAPELPIVDLKIDLLGVISTDRIVVRASLVDSRIAGFTVSGDFGFVADWSGDPALALSAGGFHPQFPAPAALAGMRRLSVDLSPPIGLGFRAEAYLAVTAGSVQLGARVEIFYEAGPVLVEGHLGFDALVQWSPRFAFIIDLNAGVSVQFEGESIAGVCVALHLEGPSPWRASGSGSFRLIFKIPFEIGPITWGDESNRPPPVVSPGRIVREQLGQKESWRAVFPDQGDRFVRITLPDAGDSDAGIPVHPLGAFEVRQHLVPLDREITRVGASVVRPEQSVVRLGSPSLGGVAAEATSPLEDLFATGQYLDLPDDEKLAQPAFQPMHSGLKLVANRIVHGPEVETVLAYETKFLPKPAVAGGKLIDALVINGAIASSVGAAGRSAVRALDVKTTEDHLPFVLRAPSDLAGAA